MALWFDLHINVEYLGSVEIRRREVLDLTNPAAIQDVVSTYDVRRNGYIVGTVSHRYGDGPWRLVALAAGAIADNDLKATPPKGGGHLLA